MDINNKISLNINFIFQKQLDKEAIEDSKFREQLEQERRDHELALRLAQETNEQVDDISNGGR